MAGVARGLFGQLYALIASIESEERPLARGGKPGFVFDVDLPAHQLGSLKMTALID
jgi:hypothetical protein